QFQIRYILEIGGLTADLIGIAQDDCKQTLIECLQHHDMLAPRQNDTAQSNPRLVADRIADDGECLLPDPISRRDVIRLLQVTIVDLGSRDEGVDSDCVGAFDPNLLDFLVLDLKILALANLVAPANVLLFDRLTGFGVDELLLQPVSGLFVDAGKRNALRAGRGRIKRDWARNQGQLKVTLPGSTRGHGTLL